MANGARALPLELEPPARCLSKDIPAGATKSKPGAAPAVTELELRIGAATADAAEVVSMAFSQHVAGRGMTPGIRAVGGESLARVAQLRLDLLGEANFDFEGVAHERGKHTLQQRYNSAAFRQQLGLNETELNQAFSELIQTVLAISQKVVNDELALARAWAN
jgi:hypothetical protein